jgi:hypothetical protein
MDFDHVWNWKANAMRTVARKGQRCRILAHGTKNSILVEFQDGFRVVTSRYAVRKAVHERAEVQELPFQP